MKYSTFRRVEYLHSITLLSGKYGAQLSKMMDWIVEDYKNRPHVSLDGLSPNEKYLNQIPDRKTRTLNIQKATEIRNEYNKKNRCKIVKASNSTFTPFIIFHLQFSTPSFSLAYNLSKNLFVFNNLLYITPSFYSCSNIGTCCYRKTVDCLRCCGQAIPDHIVLITCDEYLFCKKICVINKYKFRYFMVLASERTPAGGKMN